MKTRSGFVSNSSSSSFVIAGIQISEDKDDEIRKILNITNELEPTEEHAGYDNVAEYIADNGWPININDFDVIYDSEDKNIYIGHDTGFACEYGGLSIDFCKITEAITSDEVKRLKEAGYESKFWGVTIE